MKFRLFVAWVVLGAVSSLSATEIARMRCEYETEPISVDVENPRLTWNYEGKQAFNQARYQITVGTVENGKPSPTAIVWKSGIVTSDRAQAEYKGNKLRSHTRYYWQVTAWDATGHALTSKTAYFETAKMSRDDWQGVWISDNHNKDHHPAPMLRKEFTLPKGKKVTGARLYLGAAAYCTMTINGKPVNDSFLDPGYTAYDKRNLYSVTDVTHLINKGTNVIGAVLGCGFYNDIDRVATWTFENATWRGRPRMICDLRISYSDGTVDIVKTDHSWKTTTGPFVMDNIYSGDTYDARLEITGWELPGFDDSRWAQAEVVNAPSNKLKAQAMPPIRAERVLNAVDFTSIGDTLFVYNFGENITGLCRLNVSGEPGTKLRMMHGEILKDNGSLEQGNINIYYYTLPGLEFQTDVCILGDKPITFAPRFSYHGFQYVEIHADKPVKLSKESLKAVFFHTAMPQVGNFSSSSELFDRIHDAAIRSYKGNFMSIPTDCPQREKNGWTADAYISMELGLLNFDGIKAYEKWLDDIVDNQTAQGRIAGIIPAPGEWGVNEWVTPVWDAAMFVVPWHLYQYYGDTRGIAKLWNTCERYLQYLEGRENEDGLITYGELGDWVFFKTKTPPIFTTNCYYFYENKLMCQFARLLGKDGEKYNKKAEKLRNYINTHFFDPNNAIYSEGSQAAQSVALYLGIVEPQYEQAVANNLSTMVGENGENMDFGVLGTKTVLRMLTKYGHAEQAVAMALRDEMPSWGYWLKRLNTLGEKWDLFADFRDASYNHVFFGDIAAWMVNDLAGITADDAQPGFKHFFITPHFVPQLSHAEATYNSPQGLIECGWQRVGNKVKMNVTVPANTSATLITGNEQRELASGKYNFEF